MEMGKRIHLKVLLGACCWLWMYVALAGAQSDSGLKRTLIGDKAKCQPDIEGAKDNDTVVVHYTGTLASSGKQFDTSQGGEPISFVLGKGSVIKGWDEGLKKTCVGESLRLEVPAALAYGDKGQHEVQTSMGRTKYMNGKPLGTPIKFCASLETPVGLETHVTIFRHRFSPSYQRLVTG